MYSFFYTNGRGLGNTESMSQSDNFSIRQMIELTGLSEFTIRGWENRYQAFSPQRTDTGRREYSKKDVERALLIRELLKRGHKIGKIAKLTNPKLQSLFENPGETDHSMEKARGNRAISDSLELMSLQKWTELADHFKKVHYDNTSDLIHLFFLPLLQELAVQINSGIVSIAQEHVLSSLLKEKIYSVLSQLDRRKQSQMNSRGPLKKGTKKIRFVLATPEGDYHEIGLLLAHLLIRSYGYTSLFLGPHTPPQDLSETALRFEASHLLIVSTVSKQGGARQHLLNFVSDVQKKMGVDTKILLAGNQVPHLPNEKNLSLLGIDNFLSLEKYLQTLGE